MNSTASYFPPSVVLARSDEEMQKEPDLLQEFGRTLFRVTARTRASAATIGFKKGTGFQSIGEGRLGKLLQF